MVDGVHAEHGSNESANHEQEPRCGLRAASMELYAGGHGRQSRPPQGRPVQQRPRGRAGHLEESASQLVD